VREVLGGGLREERRKGHVERRIRVWVGKSRGSYERDGWVGE